MKLYEYAQIALYASGALMMMFFTVKGMFTPKKRKKRVQNKTDGLEKADKLFSIYLRKKYDKGGYSKCFTCGAIVKTFGGLYGMHCGHFHSRERFLTRFDERNCRPQCYVCNSVKGGMYKVFEKKLTDENGIIVMQELVELKNKLVQKYQKEKNIKEVIKKYAI